MGIPDQPLQSAAQTDPSPGVLKKAVAASAIGNATEWFDYGIYAYGVSYISAAIFPGNTESATLLALMTFAVSFLVRPLVGWCGAAGRPDRASAGAGDHHPDDVRRHPVRRPCPVLRRHRVLGPVLMVLLRMIQGFSTGGEYGGAATFMAEYAPCRRRGFFGSFLEFGTLAGFSLGALLMLGFSLVLNDEQMNTWGWRLPFLVAAPLGLVVVYLRSRLEDTPIFRELVESGEREEPGSARHDGADGVGPDACRFVDLIAAHHGRGDEPHHLTQCPAGQQ